MYVSGRNAQVLVHQTIFFHSFQVFVYLLWLNLIYNHLLFRLLNNASSCVWPEMPSHFHSQAGWVKYSQDGACSSVSFPDDDFVVFDCEVCVLESMAPVIAVAASQTAWLANITLTTQHPKNGLIVFVFLVLFGIKKIKQNTND